MAFNGTGTFVRLYNWVTDKANGIVVTASRMDGEDDGFATGLTNCMTRDGQSPATANIPLGGFKITGLANGVAATDAATVGQINRGYTDAAFLGGSVNLTASLTYTPVSINSEIADTLLEITPGVGAAGTFSPVNTGNYVFCGQFTMNTAAGTGGVAASQINFATFVGGVLSTILVIEDWPFPNNLSRFFTFPILAVIPLTAADVVTFRILTTYTGTAPAVNIPYMSIRRIS